MRLFLLSLFTLLSLLALCVPRDLLAHRDDYLNETFVYETIPHNEVEPEYWLEFHQSRNGGDDFFLNSLAFEYGATPHWMIDGIGTLKTTTKGGASFHRTRFETRYRFSEEGTLPIDIATSLEYEFENENSGGHFLSPRLVLSKDLISELNTTLNLFSELRLSGPFQARAGYALGIRYPREKFLRYGLEIQGLHPNPNEILVVPQIWFSFPHEITLKLGSGIMALGGEERFFVRGVFEVEL